ncbi:MAG: methyltransferase domain-containing protein [Candidatus Lokiarchaeota archaeon]|nr:methyltransferase domain-containing protein [Candidatus Lokiarchaeota archaeon]
MYFKWKGKLYPTYLKEGNAQSYISFVAKKFCKGKGLDIGGFGNWCLDNATPINITIEDEYDAYHLPFERFDFIFSSHTLEHLENPIKALEIWINHLKEGGLLFLYLPHPDNEYWKPQWNRKHLHIWTPKQMVSIYKDLGLKDIIYSERDMYWSFTVVGMKKE